jgi:hypothetical protein
MVGHPASAAGPGSGSRLMLRRSSKEDSAALTTALELM